MYELFTVQLTSKTVFETGCPFQETDKVKVFDILVSHPVNIESFVVKLSRLDVRVFAFAVTR